MKIVCLVKRVEDPEIKIKVRADGGGIETDGMKYVVNPFDEIAVEEALRVRDAQTGEVVVMSCGPADASQQLRTALAMGADRGIHVLADVPADPWVTATALAAAIKEEKPDLVILGKQAIDDDMGQTGIILAEKLGWPQVTCTSKEASLESDSEKNKVAALTPKDGRLVALREVDGGIETLNLAMPAVVTCELRLNTPRYASLPGIMKAKKKEIKERKLSELAAGQAPRVKITKLEAPAQRKAGVMVPDIQTLVSKLRNEAKAI